MTQEILDCLLTKSKFILMTKEEIVEQVFEKNLEKAVISIIYEIMFTEHFFFSSQQLLEKLEYTLTKIRFERDNDSETIQNINEMITNINIFKGMSKKDQETIQNDWFYDQIQIHMLPDSKQPIYTITDIYNIIATDYSYIHAFVNHSSQEISSYHFVNFFASLNLLSNQYPIIYQEDSSLFSSITFFLKEIKKHLRIHKQFFYVWMVRQTEKQLKHIQKTIFLAEKTNFPDQTEFKKRKKV